MTIDSLTFDTDGLQLVRQSPTECFWRNPEGVVTILKFAPHPPPWTFDLTDPEQVAAYCARELSGIVLLASVAEVCGYETLQCLNKFREHETSLGWFYMSVIWVPFAEACFRINIGAKEQGTTGVRETRVRILRKPGWPESSDDELYDSMFPTHPLTLVRSRFNKVLNSFALAADSVAPTPFRINP